MTDVLFTLAMGALVIAEMYDGSNGPLQHRSIE